MPGALETMERFTRLIYRNVGNARFSALVIAQRIKERVCCQCKDPATRGRRTDQAAERRFSLALKSPLPDVYDLAQVYPEVTNTFRSFGSSVSLPPRRLVGQFAVQRVPTFSRGHDFLSPSCRPLVRPPAPQTREASKQRTLCQRGK